MSILVFRHDLFLEHDPGPGHPENAARLRAVLDDLDARPAPGTTSLAPPAATDEQLLRVHGPDHLARIAATAGRPVSVLDPDTTTCAVSHEAARLAVGAAIAGVDATVAGEARGAFILARPPGHHAEPDTAMGFCLFNGVAVAAAHAVQAHGCRRVLVLDPDVHHGNGTQHAFEDRADVLYVSSHRFPFFPGTGAVDEIGRGVGKGFTINLPLPPGAGDADLLHLYRRVVAPVVASWEPDLILVSAGFDTWYRDPLGGLAVTARGFGALFGLFREWSDAHCPGRLVAVLEGGYDPAGVVAGVRAGLDVMTGTAPAPLPDDPGPAAAGIAAHAARLLAPHWPALG